MGLKEKTVNSIKWNTVATVVTMVIGVLQVAILTRLLDKSDFGLIAIASMVISFTDIFAELGITVALIHKQNITREVYSSVYWLNIGMSIIILGITMIGAPLVAVFYKEPILTNIVRLLALKILFNAFGKMFHTIKTKNLEFGFISKVKIATSIVGIVSSTAFAYYGFGVMSLVYGQLIQVITNQCTYAIAGMKQMKVMLHFSINEVKDVLKIGGFQLGTHILDFIAARLDVLLIGRFFSMEQLGIYNIAKDLIIKPYTIINSISSNVFSAAFSKIQDNIQAVVSNYTKLIKIVSMISVLIYTIFFIFADLIVAILYAPSFANVAILLRIMTLMGICSALTSQGAAIMIAKGRTDLGIQWTVARIIMSTAILFLTASFGIYYVACGQTVLSVISLFVYFIIVMKPILNINIRQYITMFSGIILGTILISLPFAIINTLFELPIYCQVVMGVLYVVLYYLYLRRFNRAELDEVIKNVIPHKS